MIKMLDCSKQVIRVFPNRNSYTPDDNYCRFGHPNIFDLTALPPHDEIHISCTFTWDKPYCRALADEWQQLTDKPVILGGVAFGSPVDEFVQGMYIAPQYVFTSRGCNNRCPWCMVNRIEGNLVELDNIPIGNIIQDNNFLQCSQSHKAKVIEMLKTQRSVCFRGGLEADLITDSFVDDIRSLRIHELWLACDTDSAIHGLQKACEKLCRGGFSQNKIYCYVLSYGKDMGKDEARARAVYEASAMPRMQLYRDYTETKTVYSKEWERFARTWQRPALTRAYMKEGK